MKNNLEKSKIEEHSLTKLDVELNNLYTVIENKSKQINLAKKQLENIRQRQNASQNIVYSTIFLYFTFNFKPIYILEEWFLDTFSAN